MMRSGILRCILVVSMPFLFVSGGICSPEGTIQSQVCTSNVKNGWAVNYPKQRKLFFMARLIWVFYSDGSDAVYRTSSDGSRWSDPIVLRKGASLGHRIGCWHDGTFIHYAHCAAADGEDVVYRRGTPNKNGTIIWSAPEQTAYDVPAGKNVMYPKVIVDSSGAPWVAFMLYEGGFNKPPYDAIVAKSSRSNGTWKTASGFPYILVDNNTTSYPDPVGVPMTKGRTFWVYNKNVMDATYYGRNWNGQSWDSEETVTRSHSSYGLYNLVADGDNIHMVFGGGTIKYRKRGYRTGWSKEHQLAGSASGHTSITKTGPNSVIVTWLDCSKHALAYRKMVEGQWASPVVWIDESIDGFANPRLGVNSNAFVASSKSLELALVYTTGRSSPYKLKFAALRRNTRSPNTAEQSPPGDVLKASPEE